MRRIVTIVVALAGVGWTSAEAGQYEVLSCAAAARGANNAWVASTTPASADPTYITHGASCPPTVDYSGLFAYDTLLAPGTVPANTELTWSFDAPAGSTVVRWQYNRFLGKYSTNSWTVYGKTAEGSVFDNNCSIAIGQDRCELGAPWLTMAGGRDLQGLSSAGLRFGFKCTPTNGATSCANGAFIHRVWAAIYSSIVTIDDPSSPILGAGSGQLLDTAAQHRGTESVGFGATDNTGIKELRVYIGGNLAGSATRACDYTFPLPCTNAPPTTVAASTGVASDGERCVQLAAVDAAGNEQRGPCTKVTVANNPPSEPPPPLPTGTGATPVPPPVQPPFRRTVPKLAVITASVRRGRLRLRGSLDPSAAGPLAISVSARVGGRSLKAHANATPRAGGAFATSLRLNPRLAAASKLAVRVSYAGDALHLPRSLKTSIRR